MEYSAITTINNNFSQTNSMFQHNSVIAEYSASLIFLHLFQKYSNDQTTVQSLCVIILSTIFYHKVIDQILY